MYAFFIFILTDVLIVSSFLLPNTTHVENPFVGFAFFVAQLFTMHFLLFFVGFFLLFLLFVRHHLRALTYPLLVNAFFQTCALFLVSICFACAGLFIIAWVQVNAYALILDIHPGLLGVTSDTKTVVQTLQKNVIPPTILARGASSVADSVAIATVGTTNFYGAAVIPSIPHFLTIPVHKLSSSFVLLDNTLILAGMDLKDVASVSPTLGFLLVQAYFPARHIPTGPTVVVNSQKAFVASQKKDANEKLITVNQDIQKMEDRTGSVSATIKLDSDAVSANQDLTTSSLKERDSQYDTCLSTGTYVKEKFVPTYTKAYCQKILDQWENTLDAEAKDADRLTKKLADDQQLLKDYAYYTSFFKTQKQLMALSSSVIGDELGVFTPPHAIQIVMPGKSASDEINYIETLCHEYLHFASFTPGKRFDSSFFEEGLTEYFARKTGEDALNIPTNIAYPAQVKIIEAITKRIAEIDLADIYFSKNEVALEKALDLAYGDSFYKNNYVYFESLQYTLDPSEEVKLTNIILRHMGEKQVSEKEIFE